MKYLIFPLSVILSVLFLLHFNKQKRLELAFYSFQTGCYTESEQACYFIKEINNRDRCFKEALEYCPKTAAAFKEWIKNDKRK